MIMKHRTHDDDLQLLAKYKPSLIIRFLWWCNLSVRNTFETDLRHNIDFIHKAYPTETDYTKAYFAKKELDRRIAKQKKFIEDLERK